MQARRITVHGKVQGVGFRYFARHAALGLGLTGRVRNCPDLTVEILVEGDAKSLEQFVELVRQGPPLGWVRQVDVADVPARGTWRSFSIEGW